jgi:hypothetical protein
LNQRRCSHGVFDVQQQRRPNPNPNPLLDDDDVAEGDDCSGTSAVAAARMAGLLSMKSICINDVSDPDTTAAQKRVDCLPQHEESVVGNDENGCSEELDHV